MGVFALAVCAVDVFTMDLFAVLGRPWTVLLGTSKIRGPFIPRLFTVDVFTVDVGLTMEIFTDYPSSYNAGFCDGMRIATFSTESYSS